MSDAKHPVNPDTTNTDDKAARQRARVDELLALQPPGSTGHVQLANGQGLDYAVGAAFLPVAPKGHEAGPPEAAVMATHYLLQGAAPAQRPV
ncbi:MAG: peptidase S10, partial [Rhodoferax sp.]|nr:peptidase S10 [Rhodoferax sp.]